MTNQLVDAYGAALRAIERGTPKSLLKRASLEAEELDPVPDVSEEALRDYVKNSSPNDGLMVSLHIALAWWDNATRELNDWTNNTPDKSYERRALVVVALGLDSSTEALFEEKFPVEIEGGPVIIASDWKPWYTPDVQRSHNFYWQHYMDFLASHRNWKSDAISSLDIASTRVVERLADPSRRESGQTKGLVVGYVQSGKTANFTGVIAKAIDAGYRLVIVLTGTTNMLREQTQRRLDMELVGRENLLTGSESDTDYADDDDWNNDRFVCHGVRPADVRVPAIHRMTTRHFDYRRLQQGLPALQFERADRTKALWNPVNLFPSNARLIVVKKNSPVLSNLLKDLKKSSDDLSDIPALIIDDESDQASINTTNPKKWHEENKKRTAINRHLSELLKMLPRAQYVGYTATPFANVFVDPEDAEDIFPSDYLISLDRPRGYMGVEDFHDLDPSIPATERTYANSKEKAHIRLPSSVNEETELQLALDSFVLSGAIKLYREAKGLGPFKHHTMLVHETMRTAAQSQRAKDLRELWARSGYLSTGALRRLRDRFENDFLPVMDAVDFDDPRPRTFDEVKQYIAVVARRIAPNGDPVIVVNSDKDAETEQLDFDSRSVWRIVVGGNKLARGFTVEGLTITYYSRNAGHAEALMQMGRWFGFRLGYRDLVRLYVPASVRDAFRAAGLDEMNFRDELRQYAVMYDGRPNLRPADIPPLVMRHGLRPTAANKMYNARLVERRTPNKEPSSGYPLLTDTMALERNLKAFTPLIKNVSKQPKTLQARVKGVTRRFEARTGEFDHGTVLEVLRTLEWSDPERFAPDLVWIEGLPDTILQKWYVVFPQGKGDKYSLDCEPGFTIHGRLVDSSGIRGNSEPVHRIVVDELTKDWELTASLIVYPVMNKDRDVAETADLTPVMAIRIHLPESAAPADRRPLVYKVVSPDKPNYALVDRPE
ncbi:Z1 domain-containing protein [Kribbella sp. NBC_00709]|uniref:Z1 domain-containing protein n=1 Tax=Kribbella sp. NBC_00709 TaxID=2975972 RepID=UPI002E2D3C43|nr:Z1 domain-containing protein [Kribbella sp. NBC_00709]